LTPLAQTSSAVKPDVRLNPVAVAAEAPRDLRTIHIGKQVYEHGVTSGISDDAWQTIHDSRVCARNLSGSRPFGAV